MEGHPEFAVWLLAVGVLGVANRWWDEAIVAVSDGYTAIVGGFMAEDVEEGRGGERGDNKPLQDA